METTANYGKKRIITSTCENSRTSQKDGEKIYLFSGRAWTATRKPVYHVRFTHTGVVFA